MKRVLAVIISVALIATLSLGVSMFVSAYGADPTIVVSSETVCQGSTVDVKISLKNNPGIASMKLQVSFPEGLSLVSLGEDTYDGNYVTIDGEPDTESTDVTDWVKYDIADVKGSVFQPEKGTSPVTLNWVSPLENVTGDVTFATLKFKAAENATLGDKDITVTYDAEDVFKLVDGAEPEENVTFKVENGKVTVTDVIKGDVDGDGVVTSDDAILVLYYSLMPDLYTVNQGVDFDGDGDVTSDDAILLLYYSLMPDLYTLN